MKFLIFNILVFFALGYLLTSNSNQNFKSWFTDKKDQITNLSKKDYVDKLKTAVSSNSESSAKKNPTENKVNNEEKFQKEMLTQIKKLNEKINKNIKDLSKSEKKISQDNISSKELNNSKETSNQKVQIEKSEAEKFYKVHETKPFYNDLCAYLASGPIVVMILEKQNAVLDNRDLMGATNPKEAKEGTIRKKYGISIDKNSVHGSDSPENAQIEIDFFFKD